MIRIFIHRYTYILIFPQGVRRWLWGIRLLQRLRVPPGFPRLPRMPVVMLLQLGAPTLCWCKRTPQNHLLCVGCRTYLLICEVLLEGEKGFLCCNFVQWNVPWLRIDLGLLEAVGKSCQSRFAPPGTDVGKGPVIVTLAHTNPITRGVKTHKGYKDNVRHPGQNRVPGIVYWFQDTELIPMQGCLTGYITSKFHRFCRFVGDARQITFLSQFYCQMTNGHRAYLAVHWHVKHDL